MESSTVREGRYPDQELTAVTWRGQGAGLCHVSAVRLNLVPLGKTGGLTGGLGVIGGQVVTGGWLVIRERRVI